MTALSGYQSAIRYACQFGYLLRPVTPASTFVLAAANLDLPMGSQTDTSDEV